MNKKRYFKKGFIIIYLLITTFIFISCNETTKEIDITDLSVRDYVSTSGIVTAANPYAAKVGLDILKNGGNAFDAAVATSLAIGVCEMDASGLGGGGLMTSYNVKTKKSLFYNFREFAPKDVSTNLEDYQNKPDSYTLFTGVPTMLAGLNSILQNEGTMTLGDVLTPSIELASNGVVVTPELAKNISDNDKKINRNEYLSKAFKKNGIGRLRVGDVIVQNDLAKTLTSIKEQGIEYFYTGELSDKIIESVNNNGGVMTKEDLLMALNRQYLMEESIIKGTYKNFEFLTVGSPSTGGTMLALMLNMLENVEDIKSMGHNSVEYVNLIATVMQLAYGDKEKYLADKEFVNIPLKGLLSKEYAKERFKKYTKNKAYLGTALDGELPYGNPYEFDNSLIDLDYKMGKQDSHYSTTSFSIVDKDGNMVTFTQTINNFFGSGISPEGSGFFLNDQLRDFSYKENSINFIAPLKQPASYMAPTVILKDGVPFATLGTPGGSRIPATLLQVFLNMFEFNMNIQEAINAYRVYCFTTDEKTNIGDKKQIYLENGLNSIFSGLENIGYTVIPSGEKDIDSYFGGVQGIMLENGKFHGGADPRRDGKALGY